PVQRHRNDHPLQNEGDCGWNEQMRGILNMGLPRDGERQHDRVQRKNIEQAEHAVLVEQQEADQHQAASQKVGDIECERLHQKLRETNSSKVPRNPSISAVPRNSGTRNTRILAIEVSKKASRKPPTASLPR